MAETVRKNLGMVTAYAYAVSKGYTGTEEEFAELMASYADVAESAEASAQAAAQSATTAEQKATQAAGSATNATESATSASESAQAAAGSSNSANLYAQNASASATNAAGSASSASTYAGNASTSAQAAEGSANVAQESATQAAGSATTATAKANEAATSATTAAEAAQRAEDAAATLVIDDTLTHAGQAADAKKTGDEIGELKENFTSAFDTEEHKSLNLLNIDEIKSGYYWTDGWHSSVSYNSTPYIPVTAGQKLWCQYGLQSASSRQKASLRFVIGYNADKQIITSAAKSSVYSYDVPEGVSYVILSIASDLLVASQLPVVLDQQEDVIQDYIPYYAPYTSKILKAECNNDQHIQSIVIQTIENADGKLIFSATSDSLAANTNLICCNSCCNKKNEYIELTANFSTFDTLTIAHGKGSYMGGYTTITASKIQCYSYDGTLLEEFEHGLIMSDFINVVIYTKNNSNCRSSITIMTNGGDYTVETTRYYSCRAAVLCNATFAMTNVKMQYVVNDGKEDVWVFGDSYISLGDPNRWASQLVLNGHKNLLLCGFGGAMSANQIVDFRLMLSASKPKYVCWLLGMNDGDTSTAVNANWKTYADEVIAACDAEGITLILATIPNVPNVINTFKNAYVKASGKRYVDFAKAVNGESTGATWYAGMLSSDNTHPTALGAKALMRQFLLDVPEVLYAEE